MAKSKATAIVTTEGSTERIINGFKLESVPMPANGVGPGAPRKYPFHDMQVGISFEVVGEKMANNVRNAANKFQTGNPGVNFSIRAMTGDDGAPVLRDGQKVYRCFRIESKTKANG